MRKFMVSLGVVAGLLMLSLGSAQAGTLKTGTVGSLLVNDYSTDLVTGTCYAMVKINPSTYLWYTGNNAAMIDVLDNARRHNASITVNYDASSMKLLQLQ